MIILGAIYIIKYRMARVKFYDDNEEILVGNAVDLITSGNSIEAAFYDSVDGYEEILSLLNDIVVVVDTKSLIERRNMIKNYKNVTKKFIKSDLQEYFLSKIKIEGDKIIVPFKVYLIIDIWGELTMALDNLGLYSNLNIKKSKDYVMKQHKIIQEYADFYTKLICKCTISTHYYLPSHLYKELKEKFQYLENPQIGLQGFFIDQELPKLREFLRVLECIDQGKELKCLSGRKNLISSNGKNKKYKIEKEEYENHHYTLDYIVFSLLFMRKAPLIIITRDYDNVELSMGYNAYMTNNEGLAEYFVKSGSNFIVFNPFQGLDKLLEKNTDEKGKKIIKERRDKYQEIYAENSTLEEKLHKIMEFIKKKLKQYEKIEFHITTKHKQPYSIIQEVVQCDPKKFHSTKESFSNPVSYKSEVDEKGKEKRIYKSTKPLSEI